MITSDKLILPLLHKDEQMLDIEHRYTTWGGPTMDTNGEE